MGMVANALRYSSKNHDPPRPDNSLGESKNKKKWFYIGPQNQVCELASCKKVISSLHAMVLTSPRGFGF